MVWWGFTLKISTFKLKNFYNFLHFKPINVIVYYNYKLIKSIFGEVSCLYVKQLSVINVATRCYFLKKQPLHYRFT